MKVAALRPSLVLISAAVDQTLAPVLILVVAPSVAAVARMCAPVRNVAAAHNAALVLTSVAVRTSALEDHNEEFRSVPAVAASQSSLVRSHRYRPWVLPVWCRNQNRFVPAVLCNPDRV